jgi:hypothetical protein
MGESMFITKIYLVPKIMGTQSGLRVPKSFLISLKESGLRLGIPKHKSLVVKDK